MTTAELTVTDRRLRDSVLQQLEWDSQVDASAVGVTAKGGAVTLTGYIDTYAGKLAAERAVKQVRGVRAVANDIQVRLRLERTDADIAGDAAQALGLRRGVLDNVQAAVHFGHLTLTGAVQTLFKRAVAEKAVQHIDGLKGITNLVTVTPRAASADPASEIVAALQRDVNVTVDDVTVTTSGDTVVLKGTVRSWRERDAAERAAMHSPHISHVVNMLAVAQEDEVG